MIDFVIGLFTGQYHDLVICAYAVLVSAICTVGSELIARKSKMR